LADGVSVARRSDFVIFSVEAENIGRVVEQCGPSIKPGAIVAGQTSVKSPEIAAFERYLPSDVNIVTCHSLHGPAVSPEGQTLVVIRYRAPDGRRRSSDEAYNRALGTFGKLGSTIIEMSDYAEHDKITADTQAVTHIGFESMGTAWKNAGFYPWTNPSYVNRIDDIKILLTLRIYGGKAHVYSGLALLNPFAKKQIMQYAGSVSELFKLMITEDEEQFKGRLTEAGNFIFRDSDSEPLLHELFEQERREREGVTQKFGMDEQHYKKKPNSQLSLLAMVDAWYRLGINPYDHLMCETPLFRLRLGLAEYFFRNQSLLKDSIDTALFDKRIRGDDLAFHTAIMQWASIIERGDKIGYREKFDETREFFKDKIPEGIRKSNELIRELASSK